MSNFYTNAKARLENSPMVIPVFALVAYACWLGAGFWLEDYAANIAVYEMVPTLKARGEQVANMARFIQIAPMLFGVFYLREMSRTGYAFLSGFFLLVDWFVGTYFRSSGFTLSYGWIAYAAIEDFMFFTVGSEALVLVSFGMVLALFVPFVKQTIKLLIEIVDQLGNAFGSVATGGKKTPGNSGPAHPTFHPANPTFPNKSNDPFNRPTKR